MSSLNFDAVGTILKPVRLEVADVSMSPAPIDLDTIRKHLSIDGNDFDELLEIYLYSAINKAEAFMHRTIYARSHIWVLKEFPYLDDQEIRLPRGKTQSVQSIQYTLNATSETLYGPTSGTVGTDYQEDLTGDNGGVLLPSASETWPSTDLDAVAPVKITFIAGWENSEVPVSITHALLIMCENAFTLRGQRDAASAAAATHMKTDEMLLGLYRLHRFYTR